MNKNGFQQETGSQQSTANEFRERVFVALGSNLDGPENQVEKALDRLNALEQVRVLTCSGLYASEPMGPQDQPGYINAVCEVDTALSPLQLLETLLALEAESGRVRATGRWGARVLDLDLLLFGQRIIATARLTLPHPGLLERSFVLLPLLEIAPDCTVPGSGAASRYRESVVDYGIKRLRDVALIQ